MKPIIQSSRRCSCTSYSNGTDRSSLRSMLLHGSRIDKLYANKYVPLRERRLLAKLAKTRAMYDDVRFRILTSNENFGDRDDNAVLQLVDMIDRGNLNGGRSISRCSCCSCISDIGYENFAGQGHRYRGYLSSKSSIWANKLAAKKKRFKKRDRNVTKQIRSDPCTCTCRLSGSQNISRRSQTVMKGLEEKTQPRIKARTKGKSSTASPKIINSRKKRSFNIIKSSCECFVKGAKKLKYSINRKYYVKQNKKMGFSTNDSLEKHRYQLQKKQMAMYCPFECNEDICRPEECLNKINLRINVGNKNFQKNISTQDTEDSKPRRYLKVRVQTPSEVLVEKAIKKDVDNRKQLFSSETPNVPKKYKTQNQVAQINSSVLNVRNTGNKATKSKHGNKLSETKFKNPQKKTSGGIHALKKCLCILKSKRRKTVSNKRWFKSNYGSVNRKTYNASTSTFSNQPTAKPHSKIKRLSCECGEEVRRRNKKFGEIALNSEAPEIEFNSNNYKRTSKITKKISTMPITSSVRSNVDLGNLNVKKGKLSSPRVVMTSRSIATEKRENKKLMTDYRQSNSSTYSPFTATENKKIRSAEKSKLTYKGTKARSRYNNNSVRITSSISFSINLIKERADNLDLKMNNIHKKEHQDIIKKNNIKVRGSRGDYKTVDKISSTAPLSKTKNAYVTGRKMNSKDAKVVSYGTVTPFSFSKYNEVLSKIGTPTRLDLKKNTCNPLICVDTMEGHRYIETKSICPNTCSSSSTASASNERVCDKTKCTCVKRVLKHETVTRDTKNMLNLEKNVSDTHQKVYSVSSSFSLTLNLCKGILDFEKIKEDSSVLLAHNNNSQKMNFQRNSKRSIGLLLRKKKTTKKTKVYAVSRMTISKANILPHARFSSNQYKIISSKKKVKKKAPVKVLTSLNSFRGEDSYSSSHNTNSVCINVESKTTDSFITRFFGNARDNNKVTKDLKNTVTKKKCLRKCLSRLKSLARTESETYIFSRKKTIIDETSKDYLKQNKFIVYGLNEIDQKNSKKTKNATNNKFDISNELSVEYCAPISVSKTDSLVKKTKLAPIPSKMVRKNKELNFHHIQSNNRFHKRKKNVHNTKKNTDRLYNGPYGQSIYTLMAQTQLEPYECEPNFCIPYQCDPYECDRRIRQRNMYSRHSNTDHSYRSVSNMTHFGRSRHKMSQSYYSPHQQDNHTTGVYIHKKKSKKKGGKRGIRISSKLSINVEIYKKSSGLSRDDFNQGDRRGIKKRSRSFGNPSQIDLIEKHSRGSEMKPWLARCFCTLKLHKAGKILTKNVQTEEIPMHTLITHREAYTETELDYTGLLPYECEPGVCIPGECDPLECYELIQNRRRGVGVGTTERPRYSIGSSTYNDRTYRHNWSSLHRRMTDSSNMTVNDRRPHGEKVLNPNCVRIGSSLSISFELFKSEIPQNSDLNTYDLVEYKKTGRNKSVDSRYSTADGITQGPSLLKRCFCPRFLHKTRHGTETHEPYVHRITRKIQTDREIIIPTHFERSTGTTPELYVYHLDPNECEPGFCIPYQCDSFICEQRIRERKLRYRSQSIGTDDAYVSYGTDVPRHFFRPYGAQTYDGYTANKGTRNIISHNDEDYDNIYVKDTEEKTPYRKRGIKCSTNIGFSIDVCKRRKKNKPIINYDYDDGHFEKHSRDRGQQSDRIHTSNKRSYVDHVLKRCFCTLQLHRNNIAPPTSFYVGRVAVVENRKKGKFVSKREANSDFFKSPAQSDNRSLRLKTNSDPLHNQHRSKKPHQKKINNDSFIQFHSNRRNNDSILPKDENTDSYQTEILYAYTPRKFNKYVSKSEIPRRLLKNKKCKCTLLENMFLKKTNKVKAKRSTTAMVTKKNKKTSSMPAVTKFFNYCKNIIWNHNQDFQEKSKKHKKVTENKVVKGKHLGGLKIHRNRGPISKVLSLQDNDYAQKREKTKRASLQNSNYRQTQFVYYAKCFCRLNKNTKKVYLPKDDQIINDVNSKQKEIDNSENLKKRSKEKNKNNAINSKSKEINTKHVNFKKKNICCTISNGQKCHRKDVILSKPLKKSAKTIDGGLKSKKCKKTLASDKNKQKVKFKDETKLKCKTKTSPVKSTNLRKSKKTMTTLDASLKVEKNIESNKLFQSNKFASGDRIFTAENKHGDLCRCFVCLKKRKKKNLILPFIEMQVEARNMNILNRNRVLNQIKYDSNINKMLKMSKTDKCLYRRKICGKEDKPKCMRQINTEPCICGRKVCKNSITDQYLEQICKCGEEAERRKLAELISKSNKIEEKRRLIEQKKEDKRILKLIKKTHSDGISVAESVLDLCKLLLSLSSSSARHLCRAVAHPDRTYKNLKSAASNPTRFLDNASRVFRNSEIKSTFRRVKLRMAKLKIVQRLGEKMAKNSVTNYLWNINDPKKRIQKVHVSVRKKPNRANFNCNLYISTLRKKPCLWIYKKCPWFYPHCLSILTAWKQLTDILLFLLAVLVWSPCIAAMELCRAVMCCTFCTGLI